MAAIFSSLPPTVDTLCSFEDLRAVREYFELREGVWIRADVVEKDLGWCKQRTAERVRRAVAELVELGVPVVHSHKGYMLAIDATVVYAAMRDLESRARGMERKRAGYARIAQRMEAAQCTLSGFGSTIQEGST